MCTELGDRMRMIDYVEDYGNTVLCSVEDGKNCNEQELTYSEDALKWAASTYVVAALAAAAYLLYYLAILRE